MRYTLFLFTLVTVCGMLTLSFWNSDNRANVRPFITIPPLNRFWMYFSITLSIRYNSSTGSANLRPFIITIRLTSYFPNVHLLFKLVINTVLLDNHIKSRLFNILIVIQLSRSSSFSILGTSMSLLINSLQFFTG